MYEPLKRAALAILRTPHDPPEPPAGSHASVEIFRASPRYLSYRMLGFWVHVAFVVLVELVVVGASVGSGQAAIGAVAVVVAAILCVQLFLDYFAIRLDFDLRHYIVTDRSLRVREGAWVVREMTITHANVQNLRVVQGPVERLFGIAALEVDTAGGGAPSAKAGRTMGSGHTVRLAGIENAAAIRDRILAHLRSRGGGTGLGDVDDEGERRPPSGAAAAPGDAGALTAALRDLRDAARGLRAAAESRTAGGGPGTPAPHGP
jgi:membrane protein YdbS with pleckstrin-like domain